MANPIDRNREHPAATVQVLFVMGKGRSGSTLLDNVLGQVPGLFSTGELLHIWDWALGKGVLCGCGEDVLDCPVWSTVLGKGFGIRSREHDAARIEAISRDYRTVARYHQVPRLFTRRRSGRWPALRRYATATAELYRTIAEVTGAQVVVDSSKSPLNAAALGLIDGIDGAVVHLVRDPRAVGYSWARTKSWTDRTERGEMPRFGPLHTSASWTVRNLGAELVVRRWPPSRTTRLRYEDFVRNPRPNIERLLELVDMPHDDLPFRDARTVSLGPTHTVGGNPGRMSTGDVLIQTDDAWRTQQSVPSGWLISALTWPLRQRYGYAVSEIGARG